jgi:hypothetical protein
MFVVTMTRAASGEAARFAGSHVHGNADALLEQVRIIPLPSLII